MSDNLRILAIRTRALAQDLYQDGFEVEADHMHFIADNLDYEASHPEDEAITVFKDNKFIGKN